MEIRPTTPDDDEAVVAIANEGQPEFMTVDEFRRSRESRAPEYTKADLVGIEDGAVVGLANVARSSFDPEDWIHVSIRVKESLRGQGRGRLLWHEAERCLHELKPTMVTAQVRDNQPASREWAERRGFVQWAHRFQSVLDLEQFDAAKFAGKIARVEASGIELVTLAELGGDSIDAFYGLHSRLELTPPDNTHGHVSSREDFDRFLANPEIHPPEFTVLARDGERLIAESTVMRRRDDFFYTSFSSVDPEYRGRGIALAIKLRTIELVKQAGVPRMGTNNLSINAPILAINAKLGYEPQPGTWLFHKPA